MNKKENVKNITAYDGGIAFFAMVALYFFINVVGQFVSGLIFPDKGAGYVAVCATFSSLAMVLVIAYFALKKKARFTVDFGVKKFDCKYLVSSIFLSIGMFCGLGFLNSAVISFLQNLGLSVGSASVPLDNLGHLICFSIVLVLIPAVVEELFFRGLLLKSLDNAKAIYSVIIISVCFAMYHCSFAQLLYQLVYGAGLVLLCKASKSVIPCMVSHFINNFVVILFEYFGVYIDLFNPFIIAIGLVVLTVFFVCCCKGNIKNSACQKLQRSDSVKEFFIPGGILAVALLAVVIISGLIVG